MEGPEIGYGAVLRAADCFLRRYHDAFTCAHRDDLAQEAAIETWRRRASIRDLERVEAFVRTVARRMRFHAMRRARVLASIDADEMLRDEIAVRGDRRAATRSYRVEGEWVDASWLEQQVGVALRGLGAVNGALLAGYYAGSTCRELGERHGIPSKGVKARLHRGRQRLRETFLVRVQDADWFTPADAVRVSVPTDREGVVT